MKILITEVQYRQMTEENLREFLYSFWNKQKKEGETPSLDDIIFQVTDIIRDSGDDYNMIRPLWYRYNGGYEKLLKKLKNEFLNKEFYLEGDENLKMKFRIDDIESYGVDVYGGMIDINCQILDGTVDGYVYNQETEEMEMVSDMTIQDQFAELDYDTGDFEDFLKKEIFSFLEHKFEKYGVPINIYSLV